MTDYDVWPERRLTAVNLLFDPDNPRIPESGKEIPQKKLLSYLIHHEKVYDLAKSIAEKGYLPNESLIIIEDNRKKYVIEGNRRLAALKLLNNPDAAPTKRLQTKFRTLASKNSHNIIQKVKVIIAPSREEAAPMIMSRHTLRLVEDWKPLMKAKFYMNLFSSGMEVEDIAEQYKVNITVIKTALKRHMMYSIACGIALPKPIADKVQNQRVFEITTLERLYLNSKVMKFLGISFDGNGNLIGSISSDEFLKGYRKMVSDVAVGNVTSRDINTSADFNNYLDTLDKQKPNHSKKGSFTQSTFLNQEDGQEPEKKPAPKKKPGTQKATRIPKGIIPNGTACNSKNQKLQHLFTELKTLPVAKYPNAVSFMVRGLMEISLGYYLERTGHIKIIIDKEKKKHGQRLKKGWHPTLKNMLSYVVNDNKDIITDTQLRRALNKFLSQPNNLLSIDTLNLFLHNQHFNPDESLLRGLWRNIDALLQITLDEPTDDTKK